MREIGSKMRDISSAFGINPILPGHKGFHMRDVLSRGTGKVCSRTIVFRVFQEGLTSLEPDDFMCVNFLS